MGFPRTRLTICHDRSVEPIQDVVQYGHTDLLVDLFLRAICLEDVVVHERHLVALGGVANNELLVVGNAVYPFGLLLELLLVEGPEATENANIGAAIFAVHKYIAIKTF